MTTEIQSSPVESTEIQQEAPKGRNISGRVWKAPQERAFNRVSVKNLHSSFSARHAKQQKMALVQEKVKEMKAEKEMLKIQGIEEKKAREERRLANEKKAEVVQVITNSRKIKSLKRKQMRNIVKR